MKSYIKNTLIPFDKIFKKEGTRMISIIRNKKFIKIEEVWFSEKKENDKKVDIISYMQTEKPFAFVNRVSDTLVTDLTEPEEMILQRIDKKYQYEIRRAKKDGTKQIVHSGNVSDTIIKTFIDNYNEFANEKGLTAKMDEDTFSLLKKYRDNDNLVISEACINESSVVWHVYIYDSEITRLLYSISHFRSDDTISRTSIGMANRMLHYDDLIWFKNNGLRRYDWGGISDAPELKNITDFKNKFGGKRRTVYYVQEGVSLLGRFALLYRKLLRRLNNRCTESIE